METKLIECNLSRCDPNLPIGLWLGYEIGLSENSKFARRLVINVEPGSLAEHAGFKVGDKVIEINGKKTNGLTNKEISCMVLSTGDINFVVERISPLTK